MQGAELRSEARRLMVICNACRYCEGYCAVFPAMERRRIFSDGDLDYLANLCHNCRGCFYACQYAPPHEFALNLPSVFAKLRATTYGEYAWPRALGRLLERNGIVVSAVMALSLALVLALTMVSHPPAVLFGVHRGPGSFYAVIPYGVMVAAAGATFGFGVVAMAVGVVRFWRGTGSGRVPGPVPLVIGIRDALTLRYLGGGGEGCNDIDERFSRIRRTFHHSLFYGFMLCVASTTVAAFYDHFLHRVAPYPVLSWPVMLGTVGGVGIVVGVVGLTALRAFADPEPASHELLGADLALLFLLGMTSATGLVLLAVRSTAAMGVMLATHLGFVLAFFLVMPYSRFVHGVYRTAALVRNAAEGIEAGAAAERPAP